MRFEDRYGPLDRLLHRIAFRAGIAQRAMADLEEALYEDALESISVRSPVFVTALPRSGTTILLKLLVETRRFASHTYRDMPFVLCPMLWARFSQHFAVADTPMERAHGDGLEVSVDSPEAFEEMIWKDFWPDHYGSDRIRPWSRGDRNREFEVFIASHMRKIIALRRDGPEDQRRYLSKNNLNVARLGAVPGPFRKGAFLVPFREPVQHAASLLRQHRRFSELHARDDFTRRYMEAIGHHEFGKGLRPVDYGDWLDEAPSPDRLEFWVRYWIATYRHVLAHRGGSVFLISYARLTEEPASTLARLGSVIEVPAEDLADQASRLRPPRTHEVDPSDVPGPVLSEAREILDRLRREAAI